jgi:hypothetical protein
MPDKAAYFPANTLKPNGFSLVDPIAVLSLLCARQLHKAFVNSSADLFVNNEERVKL